MKQALIIFGMSLLCSCGTISKLSTKIQKSIDSAVEEKIAYLLVSKKDSSGQQLINSIDKSASDSNYTKTTTIREFFSDAFDFDSIKHVNAVIGVTHYNIKDYRITDTLTVSRPENSKLYYRDIEIKETGNIKKQIEAETQTETQSKVNSKDSTSGAEYSSANIKKTESIIEKKKEKDTRSFLWYWIPVGVFLIVILIYKHRKYFS